MLIVLISLKLRFWPNFVEIWVPENCWDLGSRKLTFLEKAKFSARFIPDIPVYSRYSGFGGYVLFLNITGRNIYPPPWSVAPSGAVGPWREASNWMSEVHSPSNFCLFLDVYFGWVLIFERRSEMAEELPILFWIAYKEEGGCLYLGEGDGHRTL